MFVIQNEDMVQFYRNTVKMFVFVLFAYFIPSLTAAFRSLASCLASLTVMCTVTSPFTFMAMLRPGVSGSLLTAITLSPSCNPYG